LVLPYEGGTEGQVFFRGIPVAEFAIDNIATRERGFRWAEFKPPGIAVNRFLEQDPSLALEYEFKGSFVGYKDLDLHLASEGTFADNPTAYTGTETNLGVRLSHFFMWKTFDGVARAHRLYLEGSYLLETGRGTGEALTAIRNQAGRFAVSFEVPYTNFLAARPYHPDRLVRQALPLRVGLAYIPQGEDPDTSAASPDRIDVDIYYELPFSKLFILEWRYRYSLLDLQRETHETASGLKNVVYSINDASFMSVRIAQDLETFLNSYGLLASVFGSGLDMKGKNFIYLEYNQGRRPPDFEEVYERKVGVSMYF